MSKITDKRISKLEVSLVKQITSLSDQAEQSSKRDIAQDSALKLMVNQMIKSVKDKQAEMNTKQVAMDSEVKACNAKIDSLSLKTDDIGEKMNRLLSLLGADEDEHRPLQRPPTDAEWFKGDESRWTCMSDPAFWSDDAKEDGARLTTQSRRAINNQSLKRSRAVSWHFLGKDNSRESWRGTAEERG